MGVADGREPGREEPAAGGEFVSRFARLALGCVRKEYPNKIDHVLADPSHVRSPRELHPAFYGCYDWHSAVHGHWLLVRLLREGAGGLPEADIRAALGENLTAENIRVEDEYFREPGRASYERPYGWAWLLKLAAQRRASASSQLCNSSHNFKSHAQPYVRSNDCRPATLKYSTSARMFSPVRFAPSARRISCASGMSG